MTEAESCEGEAINRFREQLAAESGDGSLLIAAPEDNPICSISVDESIPAVVIVWRRYATSVQLRFIHEYLLCLVQRHGVRKILGDDTALPTIHADDQAWITDEWMPRAVAAGLRVGASKSPRSHFGRLAIEHLRGGAPSGLTIRGFEDVTDARRWLCECPC